MKAVVSNVAPLPNGVNNSKEAASPQTALLTNLEVSGSISIWALWPHHEYLKSELYRVIVASYTSHMII